MSSARWSNREPQLLHPRRSGRSDLVFNVVFAASLFVLISPLVIEAYKVGFMLASAASLFLTYGAVGGRTGLWPTIVLVGFALMLGPTIARDTAEAMIHGFNTLSFLYIPACLVFGYILCLYGNDDLLRKFERYFFVLSLASSAAYVMFFLMPGIAHYFPSYSYGGFSHKTIGILNVLYTEGYLVIRNAGFASEPGFYQILVNLALAINLRREHKLTFAQLYYAAIVISTMSTAGLAITASLFIIFLPLRYKILAVPALAPVWVNVSGIIQGHLDAKFLNNEVLNSRFMPSVKAWEVFFNNPLGIGAHTYTEFYQVLDIGSFDAYSQVALRYGVVGLLALFLALASVGRQRPEIMLVLALSFLSSPIWFLPILSMFYFHREHGAAALRRPAPNLQLRAAS